ncbi:hypothetical protein FSP39_011296 [Pinctada imbricata]|uniref:DUF7587 domain-containing protein n=1 Tax=Pinctada imbricata TaxID=66713 RepID=A0AA88YMA3_PINIB|nr:hypothetical protein FSP39_011296 [Pinctada imbricata]
MEKVLVILHLLVNAILIQETFETRCLIAQRPCSIQECNEGSCVQLGDTVILECNGPPCGESSRNKRAINRYLYRILRDDEDPNMGLRAKNPQATKSIQSHVGCGSKRNYASQYISTTANLKSAKTWAGKANKTVARIDVQLLPPETVLHDLSKANRTVLPGIMAYNFARKYAEVLIEGFVPPDAIEVFYTGDSDPPSDCAC